VLAQLDRMPGVAESRVDWEGAHVLIRLSPGADARDVIARASAVLGEGALRLESAAEAEKLASWRRGDSWMRSGETIRLSRHEAGVLGARYAKGAAGPANLTGDQTTRLEKVLTDEIAGLFERMHASGTKPGQVSKELLHPLETRIRTRGREFATGPQTDAIFEALKSALGLCDTD
jgi:hypothetical protein